VRRIIGTILVVVCLGILVHDAGSKWMSVLRECYGVDEAFRKAIACGDYAWADVLLAHGVDVNLRLGDADTILMGCSDMTPLHFAAEFGSADTCKYLVGNGADVNALDSCGRTPLNIAVGIDDLGKVRLLISAGADVNRAGDQTWTALHYAAWNPSVAEVLIANGADIHARDGRAGEQPLHCAAGYGPEYGTRAGKKVAEILIRKGADVNARDGEGRTPLHHAAWASPRDTRDTISLLLRHGADIHAKDNEGRTPLHYAAGISPGIPVVRLLLSHGADINARAKDGRTPADFSADTTILRFFREHGGKRKWELDKEAAK